MAMNHIPIQHVFVDCGGVFHALAASRRVRQRWRRQVDRMCCPCCGKTVHFALRTGLVQGVPMQRLSASNGNDCRHRFS